LPVKDQRDVLADYYFAYVGIVDFTPTKTRIKVICSAKHC
jgi:hypothetical protein